MKRVLLLVLGGVLMAGPAFAQEKAAEKAEKPAASKTLNASGSVTEVSATSLTIKAKSGDLTFAVDKATHVSVAGATKKTAELKDNKTAPTITEYVKVGDSVTVKYHDMGATKHAADVLVRAAAPAKKK